jgi:hypothetical protein
LGQPKTGKKNGPAAPCTTGAWTPRQAGAGAGAGAAATRRQLQPSSTDHRHGRLLTSLTVTRSAPGSPPPPRARPRGAHGVGERCVGRQCRGKGSSSITHRSPTQETRFHNASFLDRRRRRRDGRGQFGDNPPPLYMVGAALSCGDRTGQQQLLVSLGQTSRGGGRGGRNDRTRPRWGRPFGYVFDKSPKGTAVGGARWLAGWRQKRQASLAAAARRRRGGGAHVAPLLLVIFPGLSVPRDLLQRDKAMTIVFVG